MSRKPSTWATAWSSCSRVRRIRRIVDVPLPHARNRSDPRFIRLRDDVLSDFLEPDGAPADDSARAGQRRRRAGAAVAGSLRMAW